MKLILASQSPRRKELLGKLGYDFDVIPSNAEENIDLELDLDTAIEQVAYDKAKAVQQSHPEDLILAADTIVVLNNEILQKPENEEQAMDMLLDLSGSWHDVKTGVCLLSPKFEMSFCTTTKVGFHGLTNEEIIKYVTEKKPLDKAGAYGIQEVDFVEEIIGDYDNVVGLPSQDVKMALDLLHLLNSPAPVPPYFFS